MSGPGALVISLDFELMWGVRDHLSLAEYGDAILGARKAVPRMLALFEEFEVQATWATVGLLFAEDRDAMRDFAPALRPAYTNPALSPYFTLEGGEIGRNEAEDPHYFAASLIERIAETPGQELSTHTYSHFYCLEDGATPEAFAADLDAAIAIAREAGHATRSIVFPRNQYAEPHLAVCAARGIRCYRGNPAGFAYRPGDGAENKSLAARVWRLTDGIVPLAGYHDASTAPTRPDHPANAPASHFFRAGSTLPVYKPLHAAHIRRGMDSAARQGHMYHLWWHPHNAGRRTERFMHTLRGILAHHRHLRDRYGMESLSMVECVSRGATPHPETAG